MGTEFRVYLPVIKPQMIAQKIETDGPIQKRTERILLIDDVDAVVQITRQLLERLGYHLHSMSRMKIRPISPALMPTCYVSI